MGIVSVCFWGEPQAQDSAGQGRRKAMRMSQGPVKWPLLTDVPLPTCAPALTRSRVAGLGWPQRRQEPWDGSSVRRVSPWDSQGVVGYFHSWWRRQGQRDEASDLLPFLYIFRAPRSRPQKHLWDRLPLPELMWGLSDGLDPAGWQSPFVCPGTGSQD